MRDTLRPVADHGNGLDLDLSRYCAMTVSPPDEASGRGRAAGYAGGCEPREAPSPITRLGGYALNVSRCARMPSRSTST
jgi:hypothetical protein